MVGDPGGRDGLFSMAWCESIPSAADGRFTYIEDSATAVALFKQLMASGFWTKRLPELRGKNLACWCPLDQPCHADVLLELANSGGNIDGEQAR